jgi:hypothetical protein
MTLSLVRVKRYLCDGTAFGKADPGVDSDVKSPMTSIGSTTKSHLKLEASLPSACAL